MVAAWMRAETGVGPSMASASHGKSGICADLPITPTRSSRQMAVMLPAPMEPMWAKMVEYSSEWTLSKTRKMANRKPDVADPVVDEGLLAGTGRRVPGEPEGDQPVRAGAHPLPPDEGHQQVAPEHQDEHRGHEEVHVEEELRVVLVALHVADRVQVDETADAGHEQDHGHRQRVDVEAGVDLQAVDRDPRPQVLGVRPDRGVHGEQVEVHADGHRERRPDERRWPRCRRPDRRVGGRPPPGWRTRPGAAR